MSSQELDTIVAYPDLQKEWLVGVPVEPVEKTNFKSDFDLDLYDHLSVERNEIERHVKSFFGEKLMKPRLEDIWIGADGTLDPNYVEMMKRSVNYWRARGDEKAANRFEKELEGAQNIVKLVTLSAQDGDPLPVVVNASDPGSFYVDPEGNKKSTTFIWMLDQVEEGGWKYKVFSLPTKFIGLKKHWALLKEVGNLQKTEYILKESLTFLTSEELVAYPVLLDSLIHSVEEIAKKLGFESWDEIEKITDNQLALENDPYAGERRETMVSEFTNKIIEAVKDCKSREYKKALVDAMSDMFALEAGSRDYLGLNAQQVKGEIDKSVRLSLAEKYKVFDKPPGYYQTFSVELGDLRELYTYRTWMINAFRTNPLAQEARATGCGGSGMSMGNNFISSLNASSFMDKMGITDNSQFNYWTNIAGQLESSEFQTSSSSTGKYKEYYDYKPGTCKHCHEPKRYVAHPKSSDTQCAGWCSDCEK